MSSACGTYAGWNRHNGKGETPCEPCREAQRVYLRDWRARNPERMAVRRARQNAEQRAFRRLADENRARFYDLFEEELSK